ncbi:hypothetical protein T492DRAFT_964632 [Pavlovales sp. CCMP2436]|nr:hypothetical protein T492DRAFT_964632 [Pavlovales sp. CCMP2436]
MRSLVCAVGLALLTGAGALNVRPSVSIGTRAQRLTRRSVAVHADSVAVEAESAPAEAAEALAPIAAEVMPSAPQPNAYEGDPMFAVCTRCGAAYDVDMAMFKGKGAKVKCSVCTNVWFQLTERLVERPEAFELLPYPEERMTGRPDVLDAPKAGGSINIYVGNMPFSLTDFELAKMFEEYGTVTRIMLKRDEIGRSKGFGFVEMASEEEGHKAILALNDRPYGGRPITVAAREMREEVPRVGRGPPRDGGGGGGGGGRYGGADRR